MTLELGVALDPALPPDAMTALAQRAEEAGLDLVVIDPGDLDPWTTATWLLGSTKSVPIGVTLTPTGAPDPRDPDAGYPSVAERARDSLDLLAGARLITDPDAWTSAPADLSPAALESAASTSVPLVVPVATEAEVDRVARLLVEHGGPRPSGPRRTSSVWAKRRPGIAYDDVPASLAATAVEPGDAAYRAVRSTYLRGGRPGLVLRPTTPAQVADALRFAGHHRHLPLGIRSGGHGVSGRSTNDGGLVIDLGGMSSIEVLDAPSRRVRIGPGATWKQVAAALDPYGWALGSGDYGGVGVGGLATAGGIGFLSREHGLTIDHLVAVEMVLADGSIVRADREENPDLFWGVRGAGANLGIVTAFEFEVYEVAEVGSAQLTLVVPDIEEALLRFGAVAAAAPRDTTVFLVTGRPRAEGAVIQLYGLVDSPDPEVIVERLTPFASLGALVQQQVFRARYTDVMNQAPDVGSDGHHGHGEPHARSGLIPALTGDLARDAAQMLRTGDVYFFQLRTMGGAIADVDPDATAFAHRTAAFQVTAMGGDPAALDTAWSRLRPHLEGLYLSFETTTSTERVADAFPPATLARLRELKQRVDPTNLLRDNFNIFNIVNIEPSENR
ncbi:FAD-binding protein [Nocardioides luteus]|uniref:FAD-binding protein n=1 Tax=Nocardioides luteus TaxID=1844 RepID=UPI001A1E15DF|nr:FAD-binding protein [Nocardioides luteus]MBG6094925.1 FAD/FMN-containing dehydrogenase [Nocardioides luteus]